MSLIRDDGANVPTSRHRDGRTAQGVCAAELLPKDSSGRFKEEEAAMEEEKKTVSGNNQEVVRPTGGQKEELSENDLEKASGGIISPRDPQSGLPTG